MTHATKRKADLAEQAFERLKAAILTGELAEGEQVRETRLAKEWEIGITPVREAVRRLAAIGYLVLNPNHAPIVRQLSADDIRKIYRIREQLECFALNEYWNQIPSETLSGLDKLIEQIERAKTTRVRIRKQLKLDSQLHDLWCSPKDNSWLNQILENLIIYRPNVSRLLELHPEHVETAYKQHQGILIAIKSGKRAAASRLLREHIQQSSEILSQLSESGLGS